MLRARVVLFIGEDASGILTQAGHVSDDGLILPIARLLSSHYTKMAWPKDPEDRKAQCTKTHKLQKLVRQLREKLGEGDASHVE